MAENDDVSGSPENSTENDAAMPEDTQPVLPPDPAPVTQQPVLVTRWRDRAWSFRAMLAVALATLVIGGIAGGTVVAVSGDDDDHGYFRMGPGGPDGRMPPGMGQRRFHDGGPKWRWDDGSQDGPNMMPYGQPTPPTPPTPSTPAPSPNG
jgi:hypothetical protein